ncbi:SusC/RagA family TonB-linked outer membrane protein [Pontibacter russatus]|uniref:SusC/RagA family TonB-linked outer membrane protein n=1 Tax=Pontibacter russatus TaxID=2694929 RepID=UPI001379D4D7|nr:TonB-dependent receptor [Pontibacter russatus]
MLGIAPFGSSATGSIGQLNLEIAASPANKNQDEAVSGVVTDANGEPLPGVSVLLKGTNTGTVTGIDGSFTLNVNGVTQPVLVFSFIGFEGQEVAVGDRKTIAVSLQEDTEALEEVVVVGYGTQKKVNLTGAVSTVEFDEALENRPITNASQALAGKVSGVWVSQNSGSPGSDAATLKVRGFGTLNNSDPLVLIDGVEGPLSELNPNDIESMTVLKDAASAAIYGSRAANGVVLVTTKKGVNAPPQLSYNGYYGLQKLGRRYELIDNSAEYMEIWNAAVTNNGGDPLFPSDVIEAFRSGQDPYLYPNTNYFDEVFETAAITEHNISVRGGSEKQSYYLSLNYLDQDGIVKETSSERFGLNLSLTSKLNDWLEVGGRVQATRKNSESPYQGIDRVLYLMMNGHPFSAPYTRDGRFGATQAVYLNGDRKGDPIVDTRNPFPDLYNGRTINTSNYLNASVNATVQIAPSLSFRTTYNAQFNNDVSDRYNEINRAYTDAGRETLSLDYPSVITNIRNNIDEFYWVNFNTINYEKTFADRHTISGIIGMQTEERRIKTTGVQKSNPPKEGLHQVDAGTSNAIASGNETTWRMLSYFGRINYNFNEKYLLEANLRADASSRFKTGNKWGVFPAFSAGWRLSEEPFMEDFTFIDNLKLRASWGRLGNQNISGIAGDYPYLVVIAQNNGTSYNVGGQLVPGAAVTALVDEDISWETTESVDVGFELGVLNNRLNLEFDYFKRNTEDILVRLPIPLILGGVSAPVQNVGEMSNSGVELSVNYQSDSYNKDWSYRVGGNFSVVTNEVVKFIENSPDQLYLIREGYSYRSLYGLNAIGVYQTDQEASEHLPNNSYTPVAGDLKYEDVNGDGKINFMDKQVLGNTIPKYTYGLNVGVSYKSLSLDIVTTGIGGVSAYTQNAWTEPLGISGGSVTERWRDAWTKENPSTTLPMIKVNDTWNRQQSSFWMSDLSYFKIKNVQLSYDLPASWMKGILVKSATCYINVQNLHSFVSSQYEGFDPERSTFDSGASLYPVPMTTSLGVNVQF